MQQKRLLIALVLSSAILFVWSYFFPITPPNQKPGATPSPTASSAPTQSSNPAQPTAQAAQATVASVNTAPQRTITIRTPLYDAKFDTLGAEPVSWIIKKNKITEREIYSVGGRRAEKKPLELISSEGLQRQPRMVPLQLQTGDEALDTALRSSTYKVEGVDQASGDVEISLGEKDKKELTFVFEYGNAQVRKKLVFDGESYETDL